MSSEHARAPAGGAPIKVFAAVFSAGVLAGLLTTLPLLTSDEEPRTTVAAATDGRASTDAAATDESAKAADPCEGQTWPYIDSKCAETKADTRQVRVITTDRGAPQMLATRTPRVEPKPAAAEAQKAPAASQPAAEAATTAPPVLAPAVPAQTAAPAPIPAPVNPPAAVPQAAPEAAAVASAPAASVPMPPQPPTVRAEVKRVPIPPKDDAQAAPKPQLAAAPAEQKPEELAKPATNVDSDRTEPVEADTKPSETRRVTVRSGKRTTRTKTARKQPAQDEPRTSGLQRVPDPGHGLGHGPTVVRTYQFPDGRRVTVYQRPGSQAPSASSLSRRHTADSRVLGYADDRPTRRVVIVPAERAY
jgi:hypothetical protein